MARRGASSRASSIRMDSRASPALAMLDVPPPPLPLLDAPWEEEAEEEEEPALVPPRAF